MNTCTPAPECGNGIPSGSLAGDPLDCGSRSGRWFCLQAHWRGERDAIAGLTAQGFATCWPRFQIADDAYEPLFPGYLFVRFDRERDRWRPICSTRGVRRLFMTGTQHPIPIPPGVVEAFMIHPDAVIDHRPTALRLAMIHVGERVRIIAGPFADLSGVCAQSSGQRVRLLMDTLAGRVEVTVPRENVAVE